MPDVRGPESETTGDRAPDDRLDSWKEIAAYLKRDVTTVQRWEKREGMPVHRHLHDKVGSVYAFRTDLDAWATSRSIGAAHGETAAPRTRSDGVGTTRSPHGSDGAWIEADPPSEQPAGTKDGATPVRRWRPWLIAVGAAAIGGALLTWSSHRHARVPANPLEAARFVELTDFDGIEQAAALSRDGRFAAFQSDRDGRMDVWVTQVGSGEFLNLTRGGAPELVNPSVRTLGFSPDGTLVTFWARGIDGGDPPGIGIWAAPLLGGTARPYLDGVAEFDWSSDGARLVFHTPGPGDPMFVRDPGSEPRNIFAAPAGLHAHFPLWSPDHAFIYFVQGTLPDRLDLWRIRPTGGSPERLTSHDALVSHPVFLDERTLLYLASDPDGFGPRIYSFDVDARASRRVSIGTDAYTSLAASADGQRIVATRASPRRTLWRVPLKQGPVDMAAAHKLLLTTGNGSFPRFGPGWLVYVSSRGTSDSIWKLQGGTATELWSAPEARVLGAPAIRRDGRRIAFTARQGERTNLFVMNADGSDVRIVTGQLTPRGAPAWGPDGESITVGSVVDGAPRLFVVPVDGRDPARLVPEHSVDPAWSPAGDFVLFSGADVGTTFPVHAANADGTAHRISTSRLTRGARHLAFMPDGRSVLVLRGEIRHKDVWAIDLATGREQQVTELAPDFDVRDFDVSPDGRELVLEQVQEHSDVVLIELPPRR